jgi:hypothetical protein
VASGARMIHITQCLCPQRHCILAIAWDAADTTTTMTPEIAVASLRALVAAAVLPGVGWMNPWCGICHSREFSYEDGVTAFRTMDEARPALEEANRANERARHALGEAARN